MPLVSPPAPPSGTRFASTWADAFAKGFHRVRQDRIGRPSRAVHPMRGPSTPNGPSLSATAFEKRGLASLARHFRRPWSTGVRDRRRWRAGAPNAASRTSRSDSSITVHERCASTASIRSTAPTTVCGLRFALRREISSYSLNLTERVVRRDNTPTTAVVQHVGQLCAPCTRVDRNKHTARDGSGDHGVDKLRMILHEQRKSIARHHATIDEPPSEPVTVLPQVSIRTNLVAPDPSTFKRKNIKIRRHLDLVSDQLLQYRGCKSVHGDTRILTHWAAASVPSEPPPL